MRFFAPATLPIRQGPPFPGFAYPGHVASSHLPCASTLYSLSELPGVLPTRCAHGASPFRALPDKDRRRLSAKLPLLRLATDRSRQTLGLLSPRTSPRLAVTKTGSSDTSLKLCPSWIYGAWRFRRIGIAAKAASLQGFNPFAGWGAPWRISSRDDVPGSLGLHPPWGVPLPSLGLND